MNRGKQRVLVFCFYDESGIVDDYVIHLLNTAEEQFADRIIIVTNGLLEEKSRQKLFGITSEVVERKNRGYDGGAYKDVLLGYIKPEEYENISEIVLMNDTFYGPIYPWDECFSTMKEYDYDFWGLTGHGHAQYPDGEMIKPHLQSYFLVIKERVLMSDAWKQFWERMPYPSSYREAIRYFEIGFTDAFFGAGFKYGTYIETVLPNYTIEGQKNVSIWDALYLLKFARLPIVKRKALQAAYYPESYEVLNYIKDKTDYETDMIIEHQKRLREEKRGVDLFVGDIDEITRFYDEHSPIYIYGRGTFAKGITRFLYDKERVIEGYIISNKSSDDLGVFSITEIEFGENSGVILALDADNTREVLRDYADVLDKTDCYCISGI